MTEHPSHLFKGPRCISVIVRPGADADVCRKPASWRVIERTEYHFCLCDTCYLEHALGTESMAAERIH